ncbi:MAG: putative signaling protein [Mycobacterium sp.]|nr:putative signaling protein [Mycobacterium sp.]
MPSALRRSLPAGHFDERITRTRAALRGHLLGLAAMALALVSLIVIVIFGSIATGHAARDAEQAAQLNTAYQVVGNGVTAEEATEREYLLKPSAAVLDEHGAAEAQVTKALKQIAQTGPAADRALANKLLTMHATYRAGEKQLFAAVDDHAPAATISKIDFGLVDPIFDEIADASQAAARVHESLAQEKLTALRDTNETALAWNFASLVVGVCLVGGATVALTRSQRRLRAQSDLNRHQALHDSLTGLPNRALFHDRTQQALNASERTAKPVAVMLLDIARFKDVNNTLGHHYGDLLLRQVAQRFSATLRSHDSVARIGGDEFAILLPDTELDEAVATALRLIEVLAEPFLVKEIALHLEACIGIAMAGSETDAETAMRHADVAMYEAKSQRVPFSTYELTRDDNTVERLAMLGDLRHAIGNDELVLHYQPKVVTRSGEVHSVEALVRWEHPTRGVVPPDQFIPIAETTGVIHPLTAEVLRQALLQARSWHERGWSIPVAVNVSAASLHDLGFPGEVRRLLEATGVPATLLSIELTESALMTDPARARAILEDLSAMGVSLSIDDFGTGYSSMAYLKALPVRELKIDRSFISGMATEPGDVVLVQSAVDLGHNLGLHVVAEGVEDLATLETLRDMGCDLIQGFYVCRPGNAAQIDLWLAHQVFATHPA